MSAGCRKYSCPPHERPLENLKGWGSQKPKILKKNMKLNWNFQRGRGEGSSNQETFHGEGMDKNQESRQVLVFLAGSCGDPRSHFTRLRVFSEMAQCIFFHQRFSIPVRKSRLSSFLISDLRYILDSLFSVLMQQNSHVQLHFIVYHNVTHYIDFCTCNISIFQILQY